MLCPIHGRRRRRHIQRRVLGVHARGGRRKPTQESNTQQINAVCDEFLLSVIELHRWESCDSRAEELARDRHANAIHTFISTYYKKVN